MSWLYQSRKAQVALGAILSIVLSRLLPRLGFTAEDVNAIGMAIGAIASVLIGGIAHEDAGAKQAPQNQTNVNSDVRNAPPPFTAADAPMIPPPPPPAKPTPLMVTLNPARLEAIVASVVKKLQPTQPTEQPKPTQAT